jgi:hypothetical protein
MQFESSLITSVSTLLAVGITLYFTNKREKSKFVQDFKFKEFSDLETFYISLISSIEKAKNYTKSGEDYKELLHDNSIISAKANLLAPDSINEKLGEVSDIMFEWSSLYRQSLPTKIGDTGQALVFSTNSEYRDKANEVYPKLQDRIGELIKMIKEELNNQRKIMKN